jgi:lipoate-protein ligase A
MNCILTNTNDIYFHLAAEEYLLKNKKENYFILWQSNPCVVVGKHQNAMAEINNSFLRKHSIPVARRLTGGGTVYHDSGNLNFTFILNGERGKMVDFKRHLRPVIEFLHSKKINAQAGTKNEINVNGLKISGNAEHVFKTRVLHHGTLLFNTNLDFLQKAIQVKPEIYIDKAVQSNRAEVVNLSGYFNDRYTFRNFKRDLYEFVKTYFKNVVDCELSDSETKEILELRNTKYSTWEWIFGYSPKFELQKTLHYQEHLLELYILIKNGLIDQISMQCDSLSELEYNLSKKLQGKRFDYNSIEQLLEEENKVSQNLKEKLLSSLFQ